jgi:membrane-bound inhibitor of C-type lysozyme
MKIHGSLLDNNNMIGRIVMKLILACLVVLSPVSSALAATAAYRCADGTAVRAAFSAPGPTGSVRLALSSHSRRRLSITLPQVPSADGGRYQDDATEFWIKGQTARLTRAGATTECTTISGEIAR